MEIPRPRLKSLLELNEEEKVAEKAVVAIRRKTSQVDSELGSIREDVEAELERLDSQRSKLEEAMKQLLEEQSIVLSALTDLEDRQITHKQNLELLKNEEEEIDLERKQLNLALRQLRTGQKSIKEMVNRKYAEPGKSRLKFRERSNFLGKSSELEGMLSLRHSKNIGERSWPSEKLMDEPPIKIVQKNHFPTKGNSAMETKPLAANLSANLQDLPMKFNEAPQSNSNEAANAFQNLATNRNMKKPGMLKRMRLAADKFLPEPFRINKPAIALIEAKLEEAEASSMQESSSSQLQAPIIANSAEKKTQKKHASEIDLEISKFEQKVQTIDTPKSDVKSELSQRLSSLFRPNKQPQAIDAPMQTEQVQKASELENFSLEETSPLPMEQVENASDPAILPKEQELPKQESPKKEFSAIDQQNPSAPNEKTPREMLATSIKRQEVQNMTTEAKLERLHSKLLEMKSALSALSNDVPEVNLKPKASIQKIIPRKPNAEKVGKSPKSQTKTAKLHPNYSSPKSNSSFAKAKIPQIHAKENSSKSAKISTKTNPAHSANKKKK